MGEICSLCKQAWLCGVTRNYTSWGYSPSFLIVLFFHITEGKEMGDVTEKMKEKKHSTEFTKSWPSLFSASAWKTSACYRALWCLPYKSGLSYPGDGTLTGHCLPDGSCPCWVQVSWVLPGAAEHTAPADPSKFYWAVNRKYGKGHNYCSFGDIKV